MCDVTPVRTTLDIDDDVLQAAKDLAANRRTTAGKVLSDLARQALEPRPSQLLRLPQADEGPVGAADLLDRRRLGRVAW